VLRIVSIPVIPLRDGRHWPNTWLVDQTTYSPVPEGGSRRGLRGGFDADAEAYDRTRPVCPDVVFDDLVRLARLGQGDRAVEIGCGTGQATVPLAQRGLAVTAVELGAALADLARYRTSRLPDVSVVTSSFEDWQDAEDTPVRAVVVFNALHWIDPDVRYAKPAMLLAPGGAMVVGGCRWARPAEAEPFWADVQEDYQAVGFAGSPPPPTERIGAWHFPGEARAYFDEVASLRYPFLWSYTAEDYLEQLATQSGTRALGPDLAAEFLARVRHRLDALESPRLTATFVGTLTVGMLRSPG
jgi:SAM-dependent methyltransferase